MIWTKRLTVINWMYYGAQTVEFDRSNLLTGNTGSGKSTLIDAMQVVLLGQTGRGFFNKSAAGGRSDRTMESYLRGKYDANSYKRDGKAFSSYIVIDFYDETNNERFAYGVAFDMEQDTTFHYDYFRLDSWFEQEYAMAGSHARSRREFKKELAARQLRSRFFGTIQEYQTDFLSKCGIYDRQFFEVFKTAVAYVPLDNIEDFITKNICHVEDNINIDKMRASVLDYQQMQQDMADFEARRAELAQIAAIDSDYRGHLALLNAQNYAIARSQVDALAQSQAATARSLAAKQGEHTELLHSLEKLSTQRGELLDRKAELLRLYHSNPELRHRAELTEQMSALENRSRADRENARVQCATFARRAAAWHEALSALTPLQPTMEDWPWEEAFRTNFEFEKYSQYTIERFAKLDQDEFAKQCTAAAQLHEKAVVAVSALRSEKSSLQAVMAECDSQLNALESGRKRYPDDLLTLRAWLSQRLAAETGREIRVEILADLIEITDPAWVNVTEGYLSRQRLYLLVPPEQYKAAMRLFRAYSKEHRCYRYNLINTLSLRDETFTVQSDSLAKVVETADPAARLYIDYLLGRVRRTENIEDATGRETALTADGMLYQSFSTARMRPELWAMHYIGSGSIAQQADATRAQKAKAAAKIEAGGEALRLLSRVAAERPYSEELLQNFAQAITALQSLPQLEEQQDDIAAQLGSIDDSYARSLKMDADRVQKEIDALDKRIQQGDKTAGSLEEAMRALEQDEQQIEALRGAKQQEFGAQFGGESPDNAQNEAAARYQQRLADAGSADKLRSLCEAERTQTRAALTRLSSRFAQQMQAFNLRHTDASFSTEITASDWKRTYEKMCEVDLARRREGVEQARRQAEEIFRNDFINQIKSSIDRVHAEIRQLNAALEEYTFGRVRYRFKCEPTENAEMRKYYELIMSRELDGISLYSFLNRKEASDEYEPLVKTLFELISSQGNTAESRQNVELNIERYKSFKTYLKFDLVEVDRDGSEHALSKTMGSKSGGERQTPFYIAILASLMKVYHMSRGDANSLRLVIFDEAFDKIDTSRIEECVEMLRQVGFQSIIVAPNDKAPYIAPNVERTWVVTKPDEKTSRACSYHKEMA